MRIVGGDDTATVFNACACGEAKNIFFSDVYKVLKRRRIVENNHSSMYIHLFTLDSNESHSRPSP